MTSDAAPHDTGLQADAAAGRLVDTPWGPLTLQRRDDGAWVAVGAWCPHVDGPLWEGTRGGDDELACPWHGWRFSLRTGRCTWAPPSDVEEARDAEVRLHAASVGPRGTLIVHPPE